ncbi:MAG: hypothetical protein HY927_03155 [Elusimicrobia bacterium]|nr:hypothetical protein [Elusimicrobiota bacterium]
MMADRHGVRLFLGLLAAYTAFFGLRHAWTEWCLSVRLETAKAEYLHDEFVELRLRTRDPALRERFAASPPRVAVARQGRTVRTIAGIESVGLRYDASARAWTGRWPCPWNAPAGDYELVFLGEDVPRGRLRMRPFRISYRRPAPIPRGLSVLTLEHLERYEDMRVTTPTGAVKDWRGLLDWVEYVGADAFWVLGGATPGKGIGEVWAGDNFRVFPAMAQECRRRGIKFGIYAMCYLTLPREARLPRYEYARDVEDGATVETRAISLRDERRIADIAALLKRFRDIPGVDYVGLDYIRNALGGYELVDDFYAEFPGLKLPSGWASWSKEERMVYLARKKIMRLDAAFVDAWQWWRSHRVGRIVRRIKDEVGDTKPLWAFTLTWDKGWHHGQDPVMMNDAGVDIDALMLYEATEDQFQAIVKDWSRYVRRSDVQLVVGDVIDWPLHQRAESGPKAFYGRLARAMERIYSDGPARGVFFHDVGRALWGRLGPWSTRQWLDEARRAAARCRDLEKAFAP